MKLKLNLRDKILINPFMFDAEWVARYVNENKHREDGPAVYDIKGCRVWCANDKIHREDGPAIIWADGTEMYLIDDKIVRGS